MPAGMRNGDASASSSGGLGDIMGSVWACVALLALLLLCFASCGAATLSFVRHDRR